MPGKTGRDSSFQPVGLSYLKRPLPLCRPDQHEFVNNPLLHLVSAGNNNPWGKSPGAYFPHSGLVPSIFLDYLKHYCTLLHFRSKNFQMENKGLCQDRSSGLSYLRPEGCITQRRQTKTPRGILQGRGNIFLRMRPRQYRAAPDALLVTRQKTDQNGTKNDHTRIHHPRPGAYRS